MHKEFYKIYYKTYIIIYSIDMYRHCFLFLNFHCFHYQYIYKTETSIIFHISTILKKKKKKHKPDPDIRSTFSFSKMQTLSFFYQLPQPNTVTLLKIFSSILKIFSTLSSLPFFFLQTRFSTSASSNLF